MNTIARDREYRLLRSAFLGEGGFYVPTCVARFGSPGDGSPNCRGRAEEVHHAQGRTATAMLNVATWRALCSPCHAWVTVNPKLAREQGLSLRRHAPPPEEADLAPTFCRTCATDIAWYLTADWVSVPIEVYEHSEPIRFPADEPGRVYIEDPDYPGRVVRVQHWTAGAFRSHIRRCG